MFTLVYKSEAVERLTKDDLSRILQKTKIQTTQHQITGCLVYHSGHFVHLIEGEEDAVRSLFDKIKKNQCYRKLTILSMEESTLRMFEDWYLISSVEENSNVQECVRKRQLFDDIYHSSNAVLTPGNSKLALWMEVNELLNTNFARLL